VDVASSGGGSECSATEWSVKRRGVKGDHGKKAELDGSPAVERRPCQKAGSSGGFVGLPEMLRVRNGRGGRSSPPGAVIALARKIRAHTLGRPA